MTIIDVLKDENRDVRVTCGYRWMVYVYGEYRVYERKTYAKHTKILIETESEEEAVRVLVS